MGGADSEAFSLTDLSRNVSAFHKISYLLVHGTADGFYNIFIIINFK